MGPQLILGQMSVQGILTDAVSGQPVAAATVFVAGTQTGTLTDEAGKYLLEDIRSGRVELIFSHIKYEKQRIDLGLVDRGRYDLDIQLQPRELSLETVEITAEVDKRRKRYLRQFSRAFLGESKLAAQCELVNPGVVHFRQLDDQTLTAWAHDLIQIENRATGYLLYFSLDTFALKGEQVTYAGKPFFRPLQPESSREEKRWQRHRRQAYYGSTRHFYRSLAKGVLQEEGFDINIARLSADRRSFEIVKPAREEDVVVRARGNGMTYLVLRDFLQVIYHKETAEATSASREIGSMANQLGQPAEREMMQQGNGDNARLQPQISYLYTRTRQTPLDPDGYLLAPRQAIEYGYWTSERIAELLPREYLPEEEDEAEETPEASGLLPMTAEDQTIPQRNGFQLTNLRIPLEEIRHGGPPKDGIPAIDRPHFLSAGEATFLSGEDEVLGVVYNGVAKAYPIRIMDRHEIVNDDFGGRGVVVTYCPLCGSGIAFLAEAGGQSRTFGVSGLLYNSDVLLYDRQTHSLWSQIMGQAVAGPASGIELHALPTTFTKWKNWRKQHPNSLVLSTRTGYSINYESVAYARYKMDDKLMFPVAHLSQKLPNKTEVLGIEIAGKYKAYPLSKLRKAARKGPITDEFAGKQLRIDFEPESGTAVFTDESGKTIPSLRMYWFAWYAFHPGTELF